MASRSKLARGGAAVVGASVALMLSAAIPAGADPATGTVDQNGYTSGYNVNVGKKHNDIRPSLIGFTLDDGTKLKMYCVEINTSIDRKHAMVEQPWDSYPNEESPFHANRDKINWVLHNGFPVVGTEALTKTLTEAGTELHNGIDKPEAISATQAAVWHFSDDTELNEKNPVPNASDAVKSDVLALYKYLTGEANVGIGDQPTPALEVAPADLSGEAGKRIGPFTVNTTGDIQKLATDLPEGAKLVDANGAEVTAEQIANGAELFIDVPADAAKGSGSFELTATASVDTGRLFVGENYSDKHKTQSLIVATADKSELLAKASVSWTAATTPTTETTTPAPTTETTTAVPTTETTPAPQPKNTSGDLAETGASIFTPILIGVVLLGAGIGAVLFQRHRKRA